MYVDRVTSACDGGGKCKRDFVCNEFVFAIFVFYKQK